MHNTFHYEFTLELSGKTVDLEVDGLRVAVNYDADGYELDQIEAWGSCKDGRKLWRKLDHTCPIDIWVEAQARKALKAKGRAFQLEIESRWIEARLGDREAAHEASWHEPLSANP